MILNFVRRTLLTLNKENLYAKHNASTLSSFSQRRIATT
jgi:hypothetical protein